MSNIELIQSIALKIKTDKNNYIIVSPMFYNIINVLHLSRYTRPKNRLHKMNIIKRLVKKVK